MGELHGDSRWLADRGFSTLDGSGLGRVAWHRAWNASQNGGDALVMAESRGADVARGTALAHAQWAQESPGDAVGQRPASVVLHWQGAYHRLAKWAR